jgi:endonuclease IV
VVEQVRQKVGQQWLKDVFFIFSGVRYGPSGETGHISFTKSDMKLEHLIRTILSYGIKGTLIFDEQDREKQVVAILDELGDMVR